MLKLICFDMDGVIFDFFNFWNELHKAFGAYEEGKKLTDKYIVSDYERLKREVPGRLWRGKDAKPYYDLVNSIEYMNGIKEVFDYIHKKGFITAIVSGSSLDVARRVQKDFGVDHIFANHLVIEDGKVSGEFLDPIRSGLGYKVKVLNELCEKIGLSMSEVVYIGDSKFDIAIFKEVGLSIAFNSDCAELKEIATHVVDSKNLSEIIEFLP